MRRTGRGDPPWSPGLAGTPVIWSNRFAGAHRIASTRFGLPFGPRSHPDALRDQGDRELVQADAIPFGRPGESLAERFRQLEER